MADLVTRTIQAAALAAATVLPLSAALAQDAPANVPYNIGYVELDPNPQYDPERAYFMVPVRPWGSPLPGAELGMADAQTIGNVIHVDFALQSELGASTQEIIDTVRAWSGEGMQFVVSALPADDLLALSDAVADLPLTILNIAANDDRLRGADCRVNVVHIIPSDRMLTDAVTQFLVSKNWRNILVLQGPAPRDQAIVDALNQSATYFGARIVDTRPIVLSNDPLNREQSNVALVTGNADYDVVYVADSEGEFARFTMYETNDPQLVVGSAGLVAKAWSWAYQNHGSSEVTYRFEESTPRHMDDQDWAGWVSVKGIVQAVLRSKSTDYQPVLDYYLSERLNLDGGKGNPLSVRPWDHQLRQAIPLTTANAVLEEAPITGFLHATNDLDTLGVDEPQTSCKFPG